MKHIKLNTFLFIGIIILCLIGCSKSDDNKTGELIRTEIVAPNLENADVNSPTFWDNTKLAWSDEFNGTKLEESKWYFESYFGGQGNTELQDFTDNNVEIGDGTLKIQAKKIGPGQNVGDYTSARIVSKFAFKYGKLEIRAKLPTEKGNGLWSKIWLLGNNINTVGYPQCGEMVFMTYFSHEPNIVYALINTGSINGKSQLVNLDSAEEEFHIYGLLWTDEYLKFYIDDIDNVYYTFPKPNSINGNNWPFSNFFYFGLDMSIGGEFGGAEGVDDSVFPTEMEIDYIRVYHPE